MWKSFFSGPPDYWRGYPPYHGKRGPLAWFQLHCLRTVIHQYSFLFFFALLFFFTFYRTWYHHKRWTPKFLYLNITYEVAEDPNSCSKQLIDRKRSSYYCQQAHFEGLLFFYFFLWVLYPFFPHLCGGITSVKEYILSGFDEYYTHFSTFVQRKKLDWFLKYQLLF